MSIVLKRVTTQGVRTAFYALVRELWLQSRHFRSLLKARRLGSQGLKLNVGCGPNIKPGWVNIDFSPEADLSLDLREPLPFADGSVDTIYSEHFFEHLEFPCQARQFLQESLRILAPGGLFSVGVPDTEWPLKAYANDDDEYFDFVRANWHPAWCNTKMHNINFHFRQGAEHKYAYDYETLAQVLEAEGFVLVSRRAFDPALDSETRREGGLYVDARKEI